MITKFIKKTYFTVLFFCVIAEVVFSQIPKHQFGIGLSGSFIGVKDDLVSPLHYSGIGYPVQLDYWYNNDLSRHNLQIVFGSARIKSSAGNFIENIIGGFRYDYDRLIGTMFGGNANFFAGLSWNSFFSSRESIFRLNRVDVPSHYSGEILTSVGISILGEYNVKTRHRLLVKLFSPFLVYIKRPAYSLGLAKGNSNPTFINTLTDEYYVFVGDFKQWNLKLLLENRLYNRFGLGFTYCVDYYHFSKPRSTKTIIHRIGISIMYFAGD